MIKIISSRWRKKIQRCISFDTDTLICTCRWPTNISVDELKQRPQIILSKEELQSLVDRDIDKKTMEEGALCMGVSKTVYAGISTRAREKMTKSLITWAVLKIDCQK